MNDKNELHKCLICKRNFNEKSLILLDAVRQDITQEIAKDFPAWSVHDYICQVDLTHYRMQYVQGLLKSEQGKFLVFSMKLFKACKNMSLLQKTQNQNLTRTGHWVNGWPIK